MGDKLSRPRASTAHAVTKVVGWRHVCVFKDCDTEVVQMIGPDQKAIEKKEYVCAKHLLWVLRCEEIREKK